jgi:hypothetical protein
MRIRYTLGTVCGLAFACFADAQPVPTTPPPNTNVSPGQPQPGKNPPATAIAYPTPFSLYSRADVGKSLNLTQDQITRLGGVSDKVQQLYRDQYSKLGTLSDAERAARVQELNRQFTAEWNKNAADIFNAEQRLRYEQLNRQYGGFSTLMDPDVQRRLSLTPEQLKNLNDNMAWDMQQIRAARAAVAADAAKGATATADYWRARQERFDRLLTPEQMKEWRSLTGDPFTFTGAIPPP